MSKAFIVCLVLVLSNTVRAQTISKSEFTDKIAHKWKECEIVPDELDAAEADTTCDGTITFTRYGTCVAESVENDEVTDKIEGTWKWDPEKSNLILVQTRRTDYTETAVARLLYIKDREMLFEIEGKGESGRIHLMRID